MSRARRVATSIGLLGLAEGVSRLFPLITLHHAEKILGVHNFGYANFGMSLFDMALPFIGFGYATYGAIAVAKLSEDAAAAGRKVSALIGVRLIQAAAVFAAMALFVHFSAPYQQYETLVWSLGFLLFVSAVDVNFIYDATQRMSNLSVVMLISKTAGLVAILALVRDPQDSILYAALLFGSNACISLVSLALNRRRVAWSLPTWRDMRLVFVGAWPFNLAMMLYWIGDRSDLFLVEAGLGLSAVGLYAGPFRVMQSITPLFASLSRVFFSELLKSDERGSLTQVVRLEVFLFMAILAPLAVGSLYAGGGVLGFILSPAYEDLGPLLALLLGSSMAATWITIFGYQVLWIKDRLAVVSWTIGSALVLGLGLVAWLGRVEGLYGIAAGFLIAKVGAAACLTILARPYVDSLPWRELGHVVLATAGMAAALAWGRTGEWCIDVLLGAAIYGALLGGLSRATIREFLAKLRSKGPV